MQSTHSHYSTHVAVRILLLLMVRGEKQFLQLGKVQKSLSFLMCQIANPIVFILKLQCKTIFSAGFHPPTMSLF